MERIISFVSIALILAFAKCSPAPKQTSSIPYPSPRPDAEPLVFLPGIVGSDSLEINACFSPDGSTYYFSRNDAYDIYSTTWNGTTWTEPEVTPFSEPNYLDADPAFAPDGHLYFISTRPKDNTDTIPDFDIWFVKFLEGGSWSNPTNLSAVNSDSSEFYVSFSENGNIYFASSRVGGYGSFDIYKSVASGNGFGEPQNLGPAINDAHLEHDPFISADEKVLLFTSADRDDGFGKGDIYISTLDASGNWAPSRNVGQSINSAEYEFCSYLTPDSKYFFFTRGGTVMWVDSKTVLPQQ